MTDFSHISGAYEPSERVWWPVPIKGSPELLVSHAGRSNKGYANALAQRGSKSPAVSRAVAGNVGVDYLDYKVAADRDLFPKYVVHGWRGVLDKDRAEVPFSRESCAEFLNALPSWIVHELSSFAMVASNFLPEGAPDDEEVEAQAGN